MKLELIMEMEQSNYEIIHLRARACGKVNDLVQEAERQRKLFENQKVSVIIDDFKPTFDYYANPLLHLPKFPATNTPDN